VALAPISTPNQIVSAIGEALDLSFNGQSDPVAALLRSLRPRKMMLVLDNFEHLLDGADLVNDIIQRAPDVVLLITSQVRLDLQAEWLFNVEGLAYPTGVPQPDATSYGAVQLFVQRATQVQPRFAPSETALATIVSICQEVEGMPLAIELAAASLRTHTLQEIERQIHGNLDALSTTLRDVPPRHRSLRAVFDHAWNLLSEPERVTFSRLAVFHGGFTAEAAKQVAGAALPALLALMDKSLLRQGSPSNATPEPRFLLLEPIREYALEKLAGRGETAAILWAHAAYYLALAEFAAAQWDTPTADEAIAQLDREHDNLRAVLQWARDGGNVTLGLQLTYALTRFWRTRGYIAEGRYWLADLLALDAENPDPAAMAARMRALHRAGWLAADQLDFTDAARLFGESAALQRALGETEDEATLLINAALQARVAGEYPRATLLLEDALSQQRAQGDRGTVSSGGFGYTLYALASFLREQGHFEQAQALLQECMDFHAGIGESEGVAQAKMGLADIARDQGDAVRIRRYSAESLAVFRDLGTQWAIGFTLNNLALAAYLDGDFQQALSLATESESLFRSIRDEGGRAEVLVTLGHIHRASRNVVAAQVALKEALRIAQAVGPRLLVAAALEGFGMVLAQTEQAAVSIQLFSAAAAQRTKMGTPMRSADQRALQGALEAAHARVGDSAYVVLWADGRAHLDAILRKLFA
jgi:predicted ATPase